MEEIYDKYAASMFGVLLKMTDNNHKSSEVLLEQAFLVMHSRISTYSAGHGAIFSWALRILSETARENGFRPDSTFFSSLLIDPSPENFTPLLVA